MRRLMAMVGEGRMDLTPLITHRFALDDIHAAYELLADKATASSRWRCFPPRCRIVHLRRSVPTS